MAKRISNINISQTLSCIPWRYICSWFLQDQVGNKELSQFCKFSVGMLFCSYISSHARVAQFLWLFSHQCLNYLQSIGLCILQLLFAIQFSSICRQTYARLTISLCTTHDDFISHFVLRKARWLKTAVVEKAWLRVCVRLLLGEDMALFRYFKTKDTCLILMAH